MNSAYYVLWLQQLQRAKKVEEEKKKAEQQLQQLQEEQKNTELTPTEQIPELEIPPIQESVEISKPETKPAETTTETPNNTYTPKPADCELLYEVGSYEYALCENTKTQNAAVNSNIAVIFMCCLVAGIVLATLIVHCIERKVEREFRDSKGGGHYLA